MKKNALWILTVFFIFAAITYLPGLAGFISLLVTAILIPIGRWQELLNRFIKGKIKTIISVTLIVLFFLAAPAAENADDDNFSDERTILAGAATQEMTAAPSEEITLEATELTVEQPIFESNPVTSESAVETIPEPAAEATIEPTTEAATLPSVVPSTEPISAPTTAPTTEPTTAPTTEPTKAPTAEPTAAPNTDPGTEAPEEETKKPTVPSTSEPAAEQPTAASSAAVEEPESYTYVLNTNTKKFHYPDCYSAEKIADKNKKYFTGTREEVIAMGYDPCGNCDP